MEHGQHLPLERCPHCSVAKPNLPLVQSFETDDYDGDSCRMWCNYKCLTCGGVVLASAFIIENPQVRGGREVLPINALWPAPQSVSESVPERARLFLEQAIACIHAPAGAVMLTASSVDAMLKDKGLTEGSLYQRIGKAAASHLITEEMAAWAHEVRLDANDQRHTDENGALPNEADATKAIDFAQALAQFLFVLPARVERGRLSSK